MKKPRYLNNPFRRIIWAWGVIFGTFGLLAGISVFIVPQPALAAGTFISAPQRVDMVYDDARDVLYITSGGNVLRYQVSSKSFLSPFELGGQLSGMDLSPDGDTLAVADRTYSGSEVWIHLIDLRTGQSKKVTFSRAFYEGGTFTVAFGSDGAVLITSTFLGSGWVPLRRYNPATGQVTTLADVRQSSMLCASADRSVIGFEESNSSDGPFGRYRVADGNLLQKEGYADGTSWFNYEIGVNRDGTQYAIPTGGGTFICDRNLVKHSIIGTYPARGPIGVAYHPTQDIIYFPWAGTTTVYAYNTETFSIIDSYDFENMFDNPGNGAFVEGRLKLSRDGSLLFATVEGGVRYVTVTVPPDAGTPAAITDLVANDSTLHSARLIWSAPGDDGNVGRASRYDIRYSTEPITEDSWDSATQAAGEPAPQSAGSNESFLIDGLLHNTRYYFAVKTADEVSNWSALSNVAEASTLRELAWSDDINFTSSKNFSWLPCIDVEGETVHVLWTENRQWDGSDFDDVFYRRSVDNGSTWGDAVKISGSYGYSLDVAASGDKVYVLWQGEDGVYCRASMNNGETWGAVQRIGSGGANLSAAASDNRVVVSWEDMIGEQIEIFCSVSEDSGLTWTAPVQLTSGDADFFSPSVCETDGIIHLTYLRWQGGSASVRYRKSPDGGKSWSSEMQVPGFSDAYSPRVAADNGAVHVIAYRASAESAVFEIIYTKSVDQGQTWTGVKTLDEGLLNLYPDIDAVGDDLFAVWSSMKDLNDEICFTKSGDGGLSWEPAARLTFDVGNSLYPYVGLNATTAHVIWMDSRDGTIEQGNYEIYYKRGSSVTLSDIQTPSPAPIIAPTPPPSPPSGGGGGGGGGPSTQASSGGAGSDSTTSGYGKIAGRVVDSAWQVIPNATIRVDNIAVSFDIRDGHFEAGLIPAGPHTVFYDAPGYQSQTQYIEIKRDETTQLPACLLSPSGLQTAGVGGLGEILGRVVNTAWQTIPGTVVRINNSIMPTNPGGEFRFTAIYPGIYTVYYDAPGYAGQIQVIEVRAGQTTRPPAAILSKGIGISSTTGEIFGKVVNQAGQMISGTCIRINATLMPTNPVGEFRFSLVHPGVYTIYYDAPGYKGQTQMVEVKAGQVIQPPTVIMSP